jgi:hypothetical protein
VTIIPTDRRINLVLGVIAGALVVLLVASLMSWSASRSANRSSASSVRINELVSCGIEAGIEVDKVEMRVLVATERRDAAVVEGLVALQKADGSELALSVRAATEAQGVANQAMLDLAIAQEVYLNSIELSRQNPDRFLAECKGHG